MLTEGTWEKYASLIQHLDRFNPRLRFDEIDVEMAARIRNYLADQPGLKSEKMSPAAVKPLFDKFIVVLQHAAGEDGMIEKRIVEDIIKKVYVIVPDREEGLHWDVIDIRNFKNMTLMARMGVSWPALKKIAGQKLRDVAGEYKYAAEGHY